MNKENEPQAANTVVSVQKRMSIEQSLKKMFPNTPLMRCPERVHHVIMDHIGYMDVRRMGATSSYFFKVVNSVPREKQKVVDFDRLFVRTPHLIRCQTTKFYTTKGYKLWDLREPFMIPTVIRCNQLNVELASTMDDRDYGYLVEKDINPHKLWISGSDFTQDSIENMVAFIQKSDVVELSFKKLIRDDLLRGITKPTQITIREGVTLQAINIYLKQYVKGERKIGYLVTKINFFLEKEIFKDLQEYLEWSTEPDGDLNGLKFLAPNKQPLKVTLKAKLLTIRSIIPSRHQ